MDRNMLPLEPRQATSKTISEPMLGLVQTCTYLAPTLTLYLNEPKRDF
jgi:hypothetical protein